MDRGPARRARELHRAADRRKRDRHAAVDGRARPARDDVPARTILQYELATRTAAEMDRVASALEGVRARRKSGNVANAKEVDSNEKALVRRMRASDRTLLGDRKRRYGADPQAVAEFDEIRATLQKATGSTGALELHADPKEFDPTDD